MSARLPSALEAEAALLGTLLTYPENAVRQVMESGLSPDDFFSDANRTIFLTMTQLYQENTAIDMTTVLTRLQDNKTLEQAGGTAYLTSLMNAAVTSYNTGTYVNMIRDKALMRRMIQVGQEVVDAGMNGTEAVDEYLDECEKKVLAVSHDRRAGEFITTPQLMSQTMEHIRAMKEKHTTITGLKTGFDLLDRNLHGFQNGDLIILAARPSMGKTAVALNLAMNVAMYEDRKAVAIFSLEMGAESLAMRLLSAKSGIPGDKIKTGQLSDNEANTLSEAAARLAASKIYIDDNSMTRVTDIAAKCRRLQADAGLSMILIDYIQLITAARGRPTDSRQQEVSDISRSLKNLARELNVPIIALSQLSRTVEARENKRPMLSDLRESGAIEQDADIVMMLYRDSYYNQAAREEARRTGTEPLEINIAKHRNGATDTIRVAFEADTNAIYNLSNQQEPSV
jgi:replicative DNA helicase